MKKILEIIRKTFIRFSVVIAAGVILGATALAANGFLQQFNHTSYRFVSIFLLLILASNVLAKLALSYIDA